MKATIVGASWLAGICLAYFEANSFALVSIAGAIAAAVAFIRLGPGWAVTAGLLLVAGSIRFGSSEVEGPQDLDETELSFSAVVSDDPVNAGTRTRFPARIEQSSSGEWSGRSIVVEAPAFHELEYGDLFEATGTVVPLNAGKSFDEHLIESGLEGRISYPGELTRVEGGHGSWWREPLVEVRGWASDRMDSVLPEPVSALARGMVLGERADIDRELREDLSAAGISHLIAISGQNVVLLAALVTALLAPLTGRRWAAGVAMAAVIGYALFLGAPPAILRATMMASLFVLAPVFGRQPGGIGTLMLTGLVLTAADPQIVSDLSFQLSFAAVGGLMVLSAPISEGLRELSAGVRLSVPGVLIEVLAVTTAAWLATLPIIAINFDKLSLIGIGANLFVAPAFTPMLLSALLTIPASYLPGSAGLLLAWPAWVLFGYFRWVGESASALPTASIAVSGFTSIHAIVLYTTVAVVAWLLGAKRPLLEADQLPALRPGAVVYVPALVLLNLLIWPNVFDGESDKLRVSFLDVGQGDAILVEAPDGQRVLIDGGPDPARLIQELDEELGFGSRRIDLLVLTHMATDHATGTIAVLERYDVELVAWSGLDDGSDLAAVWRDAVEESGAELLSLAAGNELVVDEMSVTALWPPPEMANDLVENEASIVLRLSYDDVDVLVTGDIGVSTEAALLAQGVLLEADVLKVAHHGSAGSSLQEFLAAVGPQYAVIQSGASNPFGHPAAPVLARLDRAGATVLRNDVEGTITLVTDGETIWRD